ncbi:TetR family transcriptional regulator C-terminal domain-containing protein [Propionispira raffinosivorans]|uniref:TetR family transcriptional regulator C-terminal domain-containing protein n=1 Tax=Propionispira raffinosivorans TaxID=86959 RepID=UPI0003697458|nr:TetR family transcriptional regulator C-terminal domain-containing protein [Propionispira raffinosivorans]
MARRSSADMEKTRQILLEQGILLLQEHGYNATGIQEIATVAQIPKGSFYNYFSSKEDFAVDVIRYYAKKTLGEWLGFLKEENGNNDTRKALYSSFLAATEKYRCATLKKGCLLGTLAAEISEASEGCRLALQESISEFKTVLSEQILLGQQTGSVRKDIEAHRLAAFVWDSWQGSLLRMKVIKSVEPVQENLEIVFNNLLRP